MTTINNFHNKIENLTFLFHAISSIKNLNLSYEIEDDNFKILLNFNDYKQFITEAYKRNDDYLVLEYWNTLKIDNNLLITFDLLNFDSVVEKLDLIYKDITKKRIRYLELTTRVNHYNCTIKHENDILRITFDDMKKLIWFKSKINKELGYFQNNDWIVKTLDINVVIDTIQPIKYIDIESCLIM